MSINGLRRDSLRGCRWSRHARAAVIHAMVMAQAALTITRSRAANSWNEPIRLKVECDRLRQEVLLLREEMRIKDSRMDRIPAQRRPHYPPVERLAILELRAARHWSQAQTLVTLEFNGNTPRSALAEILPI